MSGIDKTGRKIMIAATRSGSGKTTITCSLLYQLKQLGHNVRAFKCGPDYIDPMFHRMVLGIDSENLDLFMSGEDDVRNIFYKELAKLSEEASVDHISVIEGVMGLYDGLGGVSEEASSYHLAKVLNVPIVLIIDAHGMGKSILAEIAGFISMDNANLIKGIILNRTSKSMHDSLKDEIEEKFDVKVLGYVAKSKDMVFDSRHLGLVLPEEIPDISEKLKNTAEVVMAGIDINTLLETADAAESEQDIRPFCERAGTSQRVRIAVARDEAFCFYYRENLRMLEEAGAELVYFSPLHDTKLPDNIQGLLIGGGYPELYAKELSANVSMRSSIKKALDNKMPSLAECGGFMYLHEYMETEDGIKAAMVGSVKGSCHYTGHLVRFGYVTIMGAGEIFPVRGHEFHYYDSDNNVNSCTAVKPTGKRSWECMHLTDNSLWGYAHLYYRSNPSMVKWFVEKCSEYEVPMVEASYRYFENHDCKYYPCHKGTEHINCLFCYCPMYRLEKCPGNPVYTEKDGKRIKNCVNCTFPHIYDNYEDVIKTLKASK